MLDTTCELMCNLHRERIRYHGVERTTHSREMRLGLKMHSPYQVKLLRVIRGVFRWKEVVPGRRVTLPPTAWATSSLHSFYFTLTASVYMAHFTLVSYNIHISFSSLPLGAFQWPITSSTSIFTVFLCIFILTHPINFPSGRKPEHSEKTHEYFWQRVDELFTPEARAIRSVLDTSVLGGRRLVD